MYSILILAPQDDVEELDLPEALDPQLCSRLSGKRDLPLSLQQPLLFLIGPLSLQRDYLLIKNAVGDLCSERFIEVLANLSVPFTAYPANLLERGTDHPVSDRYFFWLPKRIRSEEVVDWERSEVRTDAVVCYEEALASAQQLVQVKDKAYLAWYELALAHKALGHDEEALQALERALRAGGNALPTIPQSKGDWLYQLGRYEEARAAYEFGLRGSPRVRALWAGKTKALRALKRDQEAEAAEQELQRLEQRRAEQLKRGPI